MQRNVQSVYADELSPDADFWRDCEREWGRGSGYRDRVNGHNTVWFKASAGKDADNRVRAVIREEWSQTIASVGQLMPRA